MPYQVGDVVVVAEGDPLVCGSGRYDRAVVGQVEPLWLVSEQGDMLWSCTHDSRKYKVVGTADPEVLKIVLARVERYKALQE